MAPDDKVVKFELVTHYSVKVKTYTFDLWKDLGNGYQYLRDCIDKASTCQVGHPIGRLS